MGSHNKAINVRVEAKFFFWLACVIVFLVFVGFTPTYFAPISTGTLSGIPSIIHVHATLFLAWTLYFPFQTWLISSGRFKLHRSLGLVGISLATAMVVIGCFANLFANQKRIEAGNTLLGYGIGFAGLAAIFLFGILIALAITYRKRPDYHMRFVVLATCMLLNPPVGRIYRPFFSPAQPPLLLLFLTIDTLLLACLIYDWKTLRRPHNVTIGAGASLLGFQLALLLGFQTTMIWHDIYDSFLSLIS